MGNPVLQGRVPPDVETRVKEWREENNIETQSDAVRRLIIRGLDAAEQSGETSTSSSFWYETLNTVGAVLAAATVIGFVFWLTTPTSTWSLRLLGLAFATIATTGAAYRLGVSP